MTHAAALFLGVIALLALWLPFLLLSAYAFPALDDFVEAQWGDFWSLQVWRYRTYTGRFAGSALQNLTPWHWHSLDGYRLSALARVLFFMSALGWFGVVLNRAWLRATTGELLYLGCLVSVALLTNLPSPAQLFYWYSSSVIYLLPFGVLLIGVALLLEGDRPARFGLAALCFLYVSGNVEMLPLLVLSLGVPIAIRYRTEAWARRVALTMATTAGGLALSLFAPGNLGRASQMGAVERTGDLAGFVVDVVAHAGQSFVAWSLQRYTVLAALLATPVFWRCARVGLPHVTPLTAAGVWVFALLVLYVPPLWGLGFTVERVDALCFCVFVLGLFAWTSAVVVDLERRGRCAHPARHLGTPAWWLPLGLLLALPLLPHRNMIDRAYEDLWSGRAAAYADAEDRRAELIRHSHSVDVVVPPLGTVSYLVAPIVRRTPYGEDVLSATPEEWWGNNLYASVYGKRTLRIEPEE